MEKLSCNKKYKLDIAETSISLSYNTIQQSNEFFLIAYQRFLVELMNDTRIFNSDQSINK